MKKVHFILLITSLLSACNHTENHDKALLKTLALVDYYLTRRNNIIDINKMLFDKIKNEYNNDPRNRLIFDAAIIARNLSDTLITEIDKLKMKSVKLVTGLDSNLGDTILSYPIKENEIASLNSLMMADSEDGSKGEAHKLRLLINRYRINMIKLFLAPPVGMLKDTSKLKIGVQTHKYFNLEEHKVESWEYEHFWSNPLASDIILLTMIQNDIRNTESEFFRYFAERMAPVIAG